MMTDEEIALRLNRDLLQASVESGADLVLTTCPMCQINLEAYQRRINERLGTSFDMPIAYFTQILGLALGLTPEEMLLDRLIIDASGPTKKFSEVHA